MVYRGSVKQAKVSKSVGQNVVSSFKHTRNITITLTQRQRMSGTELEEDRLNTQGEGRQDTTRHRPAH